MVRQRAIEFQNKKNCVYTKQIISEVAELLPFTVILCLTGKEGKGLTLSSTGHINETAQQKLLVSVVAIKGIVPVSETIKHSRCFIPQHRSKISQSMNRQVYLHIQFILTTHNNYVFIIIIGSIFKNLLAIKTNIIKSRSLDYQENSATSRSAQ